MELSAPTQFALTATPIRQIWVESKTLKCALFGQIRFFTLGQAVLPERHDYSSDGDLNDVLPQGHPFEFFIFVCVYHDHRSPVVG